MTTTAPHIDHHDPVGRGDYLSQEHVARYRFAAAQLAAGGRPLRVLDVASGAGYGTALLRRHGHDVTGVDLAEESVALARGRYGGDGFVVADGRDLPFDDGAFDAVVSFETVEHVADGATFLAELRRVLRPGGTLICSTPNVRYTAHPPCHLREYEPEEFFALVAGPFADVRRFGQYFRVRDRLRDLYCWHLQRPVLAVAGGLGVRSVWRTLRGKDRPRPATAAAAPPDAGRDHPAHRVTTYDGEGMLRIMIAVATRAAEGRR